MPSKNVKFVGKLIELQLNTEIFLLGKYIKLLLFKCNYG